MRLAYTFLTFSFLILFVNSCIQDNSVDPGDQTSGNIILTIDKVNAPSDVVFVEAKLTREGYNDISDFMNILTDSTADLTLTDIHAGTWHLIVNAMDSSETILYAGETDVIIYAGFTTQVSLILTPTGEGTGNIYIWVTWGTTSAFGNAINFDGNGDYACTFNNPYFPTINGTIEAWVKVRSLSPPGGNQGEVFIAKNEEQWNQGDFYVFFDYNSGKLKSRVQDYPSSEIDVQSNNSFWSSTEEWFHYAFTWGSNGMKMYINGILQNNQNNVTYSAFDNTCNFYVGSHGYKLHNGTYVVSDFFDGQIDELRIWNYQKTGSQISALMNSPLDSHYYSTSDSGLVGYWRFDLLEDLGINNDGPDDVRDLSVNHNHLDLNGDAYLVHHTQ